MCWPLSPRLIGNMDTPSSLVGSLYSRDGIPLQQFQDGHGRCFFSRSRAQEQRKDPVAQSLFREAGQPPCQRHVTMWMPCQWMVRLHSTLRNPFAKRGCLKNWVRKLQALRGWGLGAAKFDSYLFRHPGSITGFWVQKDDGKAPSSPMWLMLIHQKSTPVHRVSEKEGRPCCEIAGMDG